jgi:hypothetical protein
MNRATLTLIQVLSFFLVGTVAPTLLADEEGEATSPKGDFKIESETKPPPTNQDEGEISVFVVSTSDPGAKELLHQHPETTHYYYYISPDGNWIYGQASYGSRMSGGRLFKRLNGLKFDPVPNGDDFDDAVWKFFARTEKTSEKRVPYFDSREGMIQFVAWSPDSGRVLLSLICGDFDGKRERGIQDWYLYFNTRTGRFELTNRLRTLNKDAWKRRADEFADEASTATARPFTELTEAEPLTQGSEKPPAKKRP